MAEDKNKYNSTESVLQSINRNYISLPDGEVSRNNKILQEVLNQIIAKMKEKNTLFKYTFGRVFYGGSYYDGLRVGKPEEYDLDLLLKLPKLTEPTLTTSNMPGFVQLQLKAMEKFKNQPEAHRFSGMETDWLDDEHYLVTSKVSAWMERVVTTALNEFDKSENTTLIKTENSGTFKATIRKGGPAFTINIKGTANGQELVMDIDLVPCFVFKEDKWPQAPYRPNPVPGKDEFFIVPKKPGSDGNVRRYWRLSFQEQERVLINGLQTLKPTVKLLKKLRDTLDHKPIASYFIKTIFLWEVEKDRTLFGNPLNFVFIQMLKKYQEYMAKGEIPYFWYEENNLVGKINSKTLENYANKIRNIIQEIERKFTTEPHIVAKYLIQADQIEQLKSETVIEKKEKKQNQQLQDFETDGSSSSSPGTKSVMKSLSTSCIGTNGNLMATNRSCSQKLFTSQEGFVHSELNTIGNSVETVLKEICKLHDSTTKITETIAKLQEDNRNIFSVMQNLLEKMEGITGNLEDLRKENQMLKIKLNEGSSGHEQDSIDELCDRLSLTARYDINT